MVEKIIKKTTTNTALKKPATGNKKPVAAAPTTATTKTTATKVPSTSQKATETKPKTPAAATNATTSTTNKTSNKKTINNNQLNVGDKIKAIATEIRNFELVLKYKEYTCKVHCLNSEQPFSKLMLEKEWEGTIISVDETAKIIILTFNKPEPLSKDFTVGQTITAINYGQVSYNEIATWISPTQIGYIDVISNFKNYNDFVDFGQRKKPFKCLIKSINSDNKIYLSLIENNQLNKKLSVGDKILGTISEIGVLSMKVKIYNNLSGEVKLIDCNDEFRDSPFSIYSVGSVIKVFVKSISKDGISLSLKKSLLGPEHKFNPKYKNNPTQERAITNVFSHGSHAWGYIIEKNQQIVRVELADKLNGVIQNEVVGPFHMHLCEVGSLIQVTVLGDPKVEGSNQVLNCSIRIDKKITLQTLKTDDILPLEVTRVETFGLFVRHSNITALVHIKESSDEKLTPEQLAQNFSVGDLVLGKCIGQKFSKEKNKNFFNFSLKPEHFVDVDTESYFKVSWDNQDPTEEQQSINTHISLSVQLKSIQSIKPYLVEKEQKKGELSAKQLQQNLNNDQEEQQPLEEAEDDEFKSTSLLSLEDSKKRKKDETDEADEFEENQVVDKKKQKTEKEKSKNKQEEEIKEREDLLADHNVAPESPQDFERLLLGSPNSSYLWIKYMSYYLSLSEISKARETGEKAIKKILATEVLEQRNIWIALYNLENLYGTAETLLKLFQRSIQYQDPKTMYLTIIQILESTNKVERCEEYFKMLFKKTKSSAKIWCRYGEFLLKNQKLDQFNGVLSRALECLPKKKQIKVINKFGQLEYKLGDVERGRTIFEGLVSNYPNRTDIWNIYLDMELRDKESIKSNKDLRDKIRELFNRTVNLKVSDRNIKQFFKRFLTFEKDFGNPRSIDDVKKLALKFVENN
ncbi:hypothetical protein DICPUDRAFT_152947 [Dictyostelium purpureum]|uniref:S1 motif domain-containing protein n=1 Tax=Dictyostelium purpureum TaxID=5786 RepID=F0ZMP0_DICPU|nr:uncharacterized protein DICPUDRAFT_152947 [Dictyostelium purpureum]EGC34777.1 hypothetical protein DICPUDRAFT_152947 [Dictyostelium purpureum]|eukprot:XP_003288692.1 hypothetical protein DICPUDRAFT_152947 [Dictyostelium purpureum]